MKNMIFLFLLLGMFACTTTQKSDEGPERPSNIILLIGDGMGVSAVSAGTYFRDEPSSFNRFKYISLVNTSSATHKVTDSAASGTALSTGKKTYNGAVGMDTARNVIENITEFVSGLGWNTGVVSTSSITHATPASFYAHVEQRQMEEDIAVQLLDSEIDFFAGGGIKFFTKRTDGANLFPVAEEKGFMVDTTGLSDPSVLKPGQKYGFLLAEAGMLPMLEGRGGFLPEATALAISHLSGENGFFLMVEGSQIDWEGHANNPEGVIQEVLDFENAIDMALDFAEKDGNTLVVVTADHETGGFALSGKTDSETGESDYRLIGPTFATGGHTATLIPVFAYGPGAEEFMGIYQNTGIPSKMIDLVKGL